MNTHNHHSADLSPSLQNREQILAAIEKESEDLSVNKRLGDIVVEHAADFARPERAEGGALDKPREEKLLEIGPNIKTMLDSELFEKVRNGQRPTIVTVDLPNDTDRYNGNMILKDSSVDAVLRTGKNPDPREGYNYYDERNQADYLAMIGDGRDMPYFEDDEFETVGLRKLIEDRSIENDDALELMKEALRVGGRVELFEDVTDIRSRRLGRFNFAEAGVSVEVGEEDTFALGNRVTLTKNEAWGEKPLEMRDRLVAVPMGFGDGDTTQNARQYFELREEAVDRARKKENESKLSRMKKIGRGVLRKN